MENEYFCEVCKYKTKDRRNYIRHCKTRKHLRREEAYIKLLRYTSDKQPPKTPSTAIVEGENGYVCEYCKHKYGRFDNLQRHIPKCMVRILKEKEDQLDAKDELLKQNEEDMYYFRQLLKVTGKNKGISDFNYIKNNYPDAKPLKKLTFSKYKKLKGMTYDPESELTEDEQVIQDTLRAYRQGVLHEEIGDTILDFYKKKKPGEQSLWCTDESRVKYIVRRRYKGFDRWMADKKGQYSQKQIVTPMLETLKKMLIAYDEKFCTDSKKNRTKRGTRKKPNNSDTDEDESNSESNSSSESDETGSGSLDSRDSKFDWLNYDDSKITDPLARNLNTDIMERDGLTIWELMTDIDNKKLHKKIMKYMTTFLAITRKTVNDNKKKNAKKKTKKSIKKKSKKAKKR